MADALYDYYISVLGANFERSRRFDLQTLGVPQIARPELEHLFTEEEVRSVIANLPNDKALGPDGFTGLFYKKGWGTIKMDVMNAFNALWSRDCRSFNHLNDAYMIVLTKRNIRRRSVTIALSASYTVSASSSPSAWPTG